MDGRDDGGRCSPRTRSRAWTYCFLGLFGPVPDAADEAVRADGGREN